MNKKFTIFVKNPLVYEVDRITKEAEAAGLSCNVMSKLSTDDLENMDNLVGSVVLWRSLLNSDPCSKAVVWEKMQNRKIINNIWKDRYFVTHKSYQQEVVKQNFAQYAIPTYVYRNKEEILEAQDLIIAPTSK